MHLGSWDAPHVIIFRNFTVLYKVSGNAKFRMLGKWIGNRFITYSKGRRGRNESFHPSVRPVIPPIIRSIIHPWMASYNNPLQCEG